MSIQNPNPSKNTSPDDKNVPPDNKLTEDTTKLNPNNVKEQVVSAVYIDKAGYVQNAGFTKNTIPVIEHGPITGPHAIILHRTDSYNLAGSLSSFEKSKLGTHFIIDKDGTVYQTASLLKYTYHIGRIRARCERNGVIFYKDIYKNNSYSVAIEKIFQLEKKKKYPDRYPYNLDAIGIEVVAKCLSHSNDGRKATWETATEAQISSVAKLVKILQKEYKLTDEDLYQHQYISYKMHEEGYGLYPLADTNGNIDCKL